LNFEKQGRSSFVLNENQVLVERIEAAANEIEADYETAVEVVRNLKQKMNHLEQRISQDNGEQSLKDLNSLRASTDSLDQFVDSQILKSKRAWERCRELENDCKAQGASPAQLSQLSIVCKKTEQLAADLLCFSLGHLKQTSVPKNET